MTTSRLLAELLLAPVAGCETTPIEVRDHGALALGGRAVWRADKGEGASASWFGLELDGTTVEGDDTQDRATSTCARTARRSGCAWTSDR